MNIIDNDLLSIQEARILAENAAMAKRQLAEFSQEKLDVIVEGMPVVRHPVHVGIAKGIHHRAGFPRAGIAIYVGHVQVTPGIFITFLDDSLACHLNLIHV